MGNSGVNKKSGIVFLMGCLWRCGVLCHGGGANKGPTWALVGCEGDEALVQGSARFSWSCSSQGNKAWLPRGALCTLGRNLSRNQQPLRHTRLSVHPFGGREWELMSLPQGPAAGASASARRGTALPPGSILPCSAQVGNQVFHPIRFQILEAQVGVLLRRLFSMRGTGTK